MNNFREDNLEEGPKPSIGRWIIVSLILLISAIGIGFFSFRLGQKKPDQAEVIKNIMPPLSHTKKEILVEKVDLDKDGRPEYLRLEQDSIGENGLFDVTFTIHKISKEHGIWEPVTMQFLDKYSESAVMNIKSFVNLMILPDFTNNEIDEIVTISKEEGEGQTLAVKVWSYDPKSPALKIGVIWERKFPAGEMKLMDQGILITQGEEENLFVWDGVSFSSIGSSNQIEVSPAVDYRISKERAVEIAKSFVRSSEIPLESHPVKVTAEEFEVIFDPVEKEYITMADTPPSEISNRYERRKAWLVSLVYNRADNGMCDYTLNIDSTNGRVANQRLESY